MAFGLAPGAAGLLGGMGGGIAQAYTTMGTRPPVLPPISKPNLLSITQPLQLPVATVLGVLSMASYNRSNQASVLA